MPQGICSNLGRCSKALTREAIELYPGFGEVCPECGRALTPIESADTAAPSAPSAYVLPVENYETAYGAGGSAPASVAPAPAAPPPAAPPEPPPARPRSLITGHAPGIEGAPPAGGRIPIIQPIRPPDAPPAPQAPPPMAAAPAYEPPPYEAAAAPAPEPEPPADVHAAEAAPSVAPDPAVDEAAAPVADHWFIPPPDTSGASSVQRRGTRRPALPRAGILAAVGVGLLAIGAVLWIRSFFAGTPAGVPISAAFRICGSHVIADQLGLNLAKAFLTKSGAQSVTATQSGSAIAVSGKLAGQWQPRTIAIDASDDRSVIAGIAGKQCQVGMMATPVDNRGDLANSGILGKVIGYDAIVIVANPANPVGHLSLDNIAKIFSGAVSDWSQVGGPHGRIDVFAPDQPAYYLGAFRRVLLKAAVLPSNAHVVPTQADVSAAVARDRNAIGFVGFLFAEPGHVVKVAADNGNEYLPTVGTIGSKDYPLTIPMFMYFTAQQTEPMVFDFLDFVRSDAGQTVVEDKGYVSRLSL